MKLVILHGLAINTSRKKLSEIKNKFTSDNVITLDSTANTEEILTNLLSESLFGGERLVVVENPPEELINHTLFPNPYTLVLWFDHEIDTKNWKDAEILFFPEAKEVSVFPFLDFLGNRDKKAFLELDKLKQEYDSQYLITMILYLLRNLSCTPKGAKEFVKAKFAKMRKNFSEEKLINMYKFVLNTDFKIKSGLIETTQAEFSLVHLFLN